MFLTLQLANKFVELPLKGLTKEYPNSLHNILISQEDVLSPKELHPVFYGCYDWHSAVHGYWLLLKCLNKFDNLDKKEEITTLFNEHFTKDKMVTEYKYLAVSGREHFERLYGWAWVFYLKNELLKSKLKEAKQWLASLDILVELLETRLLDFLVKQKYPARVGSHNNTAFSLILIHSYADIVKNKNLIELLKKVSLNYYGEDAFYPFNYELSYDDFLSNGLCEIFLMSQILDEQNFLKWLTNFFDFKKSLSILEPIIIENLDDPKIGHLVGLNLSKAWCFKQISKKLPDSHNLKNLFIEARLRHLDESFGLIINGNYNGEHWLATFGVLALDD